MKFGIDLKEICKEVAGNVWGCDILDICEKYDKNL